MSGYVPEDYWDRRLFNNWGLVGVGYLAYSDRYNYWLYKAKARCASRLTKRAEISLKGRTVADVGSGIGFWIRWFSERGADVGMAIDISAVAVERLGSEFPGTNVVQQDISQPLELANTFDIVNAPDVLYHIVDDVGLNTALQNLLSMTSAGGWVILTDYLGSKDKRSDGHVKFHTWEDYRRVLDNQSYDAILTEPVYALMNGGISDLWHHRGQGLLHRMEEATAPILYALDGVWMPRFGVSLRMMAIKKPL